MQLEALSDALRVALGRGPIAGYPTAGLVLEVQSVSRAGDRTTPGALRFAAASAVSRALRDAGGVLLEPIMEAEVSAPEAYVGGILHDLTANRRAHVRAVTAPGTDGTGFDIIGAESQTQRFRGPTSQHTLRVAVPLRELLGYATTLRSISAGNASFTMEFDGYASMDEYAQNLVLEEGWG